jgi:uncharacterized protein (TIGR03437 family)
MPVDAAVGPAVVIVTAEDGAVATADVRIVQVAPGLFAVNSDGKGLAAGVILRVRPDGSSVYQPIARYDEELKRLVGAPIDLSVTGDQVYFIGFGTGFRHRTSLAAVKVVAGDVELSVNFAGAQGEFIGIDQLNVLLSPSLAGRGAVDVALTVDGRMANTVQLVVK